MPDSQGLITPQYNSVQEETNVDCGATSEASVKRRGWEGPPPADALVQRRHDHPWYEIRTARIRVREDIWTTNKKPMDLAINPNVSELGKTSRTANGARPA